MSIAAQGTWWLKSPSDPRWNATGRALVGGLVRPKELDEKLTELTLLLGAPPQDLEWGYMKD